MDFTFGLFRRGGKQEDGIEDTRPQIITPPNVTPPIAAKQPLVDTSKLEIPPPSKETPSTGNDSSRRLSEMTGRSGGEGLGEVGARSWSFGGGSSWSSKTAFESITGSPAATASAASKGISAPTAPKLFNGAIIHVNDDKVRLTGKLVGYQSNGRAILQQDGKKAFDVPRDAKIALIPNQEWSSALETVPARNLYRPSASELASLMKLVEERAGGERVKDYVKAIRAEGFEAFVSGGAIRDVLVGASPRDVDLCTTMWCDDVADAARKARLSTGSSRSQYGTVLIGGLDVCSLKRSKGEFGFDLMDDAKFRDFTINGLYFDPASGLIADPFGTGVSDAKNKILRPNCPPGQEQAWIRNNSSAALRIIKFTLKGYKPTPELLKVLKENFKWAMSDMDGFRKSRTMESIRGASRSEINAELKRLGIGELDGGFSSGPSWMNRRDDDDFVPSWRRNSGDDKKTGGDDRSTTPMGGSWISTGPGRSRYVAGGSNESSGSSSSSGTPIEKLIKDHGLTIVRPSMRSADLAIARGHLGFVASRESEAASTLERAGFKKSGPGFWKHQDGSWVRFVDTNVFRGHDKNVFLEIPWGSGPK